MSHLRDWEIEAELASDMEPSYFYSKFLLYFPILVLVHLIIFAFCKPIEPLHSCGTDTSHQDGFSYLSTPFATTKDRCCYQSPTRCHRVPPRCHGHNMAKPYNPHVFKDVATDVDSYLQKSQRIYYANAFQYSTLTSRGTCSRDHMFFMNSLRKYETLKRSEDRAVSPASFERQRCPSPVRHRSRKESSRINSPRSPISSPKRTESPEELTPTKLLKDSDKNTQTRMRRIKKRVGKIKPKDTNPPKANPCKTNEVENPPASTYKDVGTLKTPAPCTDAATLKTPAESYDAATVKTPAPSAERFTTYDYFDIGHKNPDVRYVTDLPRCLREALIKLSEQCSLTSTQQASVCDPECIPRGPICTESNLCLCCKSGFPCKNRLECRIRIRPSSDHTASKIPQTDSSGNLMETCTDCGQNTVEHDKTLEYQFFQWARDIPVFPNECPRRKKFRDKMFNLLVQNIKDILHDDPNDFDGVRNEVDNMIDLLPIWTPESEDERGKFKQMLVDNLMERIQNVYRDGESRTRPNPEQMHEIVEDVIKDVFKKEGVRLEPSVLKNLEDTIADAVMNDSDSDDTRNQIIAALSSTRDSSTKKRLVDSLMAQVDSLKGRFAQSDIPKNSNADAKKKFINEIHNDPNLSNKQKEVLTFEDLDTLNNKPNINKNARSETKKNQPSGSKLRFEPSEHGYDTDTVERTQDEILNMINPLIPSYSKVTDNQKKILAKEAAKVIDQIKADPNLSNAEKEVLINKELDKLSKKLDIKKDDRSDAARNQLSNKLKDTSAPSGISSFASDRSNGSGFSSPSSVKALATEQANYNDDLVKIASDWLDKLPFDVNEKAGRDVKGQIADNIASEMAERQKYRQQNPDKKLNETDERELLKNRILKQFNGILSPDEMKSIVPQIEALMNSLKGVEPPNQQNVSLAPEGDVAKTAANELFEVIDQWVKDLPIPEEQKQELAKAMIAKMTKLHTDPQIINDDVLYEQVLNDDLDIFLKKLPQSPDLDARKEELKALIKEQVKKIRVKAKAEIESRRFRDQINEAFDKVLPKLNNPSSEKQAEMEMASDAVKDAFVNMRYSPNDAHSAERRKAYRISLQTYLDTIKPHLNIDAEDIQRDIAKAMEQVPIPSEETLKSEVEQQRMKREIKKWAKELPLERPEDPRQRLKGNKLVSLAAKRLQDLEKQQRLNPDKNYEPARDKEIDTLIRRMPIAKGQDIDKMKQNLKTQLIETKDKRQLRDTAKLKDGVLIYEDGIDESDAFGPSADIFNTIDNWVKDLPIPEDQKQNVAKILIAKLTEIHMDPEVMHDDMLYEQVLDDEIQNLLNELIPNSELKKNKDDLISKIKKTQQKAKKDLDAQRLREQIDEAFNKVLPKIPNSTPSQQAEMDLARERVKDAFISMEHSPQDGTRSQYEKAYTDALQKYLDLIPDPSVTVDDLQKEIKKAIEDIIVPGSDFIRSEIELMQIKNDIRKWMEELPLDKVTDPEQQLRIDKMVSLAAKRLQELENLQRENPDQNYDQAIEKEIETLLKRLPIAEGHENEHKSMIEKLKKLLNNTREQRKLLEGKKDSCLCQVPPCETPRSSVPTCKSHKPSCALMPPCSSKSPCASIPPCGSNPPCSPAPRQPAPSTPEPPCGPNPPFRGTAPESLAPCSPKTTFFRPSPPESITPSICVSGLAPCMSPMSMPPCPDPASAYTNRCRQAATNTPCSSIPLCQRTTHPRPLQCHRPNCEIRSHGHPPYRRTIVTNPRKPCWTPMPYKPTICPTPGARPCPGQLHQSSASSRGFQSHPCPHRRRPCEPDEDGNRPCDRRTSSRCSHKWGGRGPTCMAVRIEGPSECPDCIRLVRGVNSELECASCKPRRTKDQCVGVESDKDLLTPVKTVWYTDGLKCPFPAKMFFN